MTAAELAPPAAGRRPTMAGFARLLRAEWTKFRTVRGWLIASIVAVLVTRCSACSPRTAASDGCAGGPARPLTIPTGPGGEAVTDSLLLRPPPARRRTAASPSG